MSYMRPILAIVLALIAGSGLAIWAWRTCAATPRAVQPQSEDRALVVYYLHARFRCTSCNAMEAATREALAGWTPPPGLPRPELVRRRYLDPGNEEFSQRFGVNGSSVLLAEVAEGRILRGELLFDVGSVPADPVAAVQRGLDRFVAGSSASPASERRHPVLIWLHEHLGVDGLLLACLGALALGLVTALMPCPLATNLAAMSFLARKAGKVGTAVGGGLAYALGRIIAYVGVGVLLGTGLVQIPAVNRFLSLHLNAILGPLLLVVAILLLRLWSPTWTLVSGECAQRWGERGGVVAAFCLGLLFALAFCPTSAALFLGMIPLMVAERQPLLMPVLYGLGTAVPVVVFAVLLVVAADAAGRLFTRINNLEPVFRWLTGLVFLGLGLWYTVRVDLIP